ncbi:MAG: VOC family protein [Tractidigestivibacter sp.]|jgi:catechol 2,3-dioxygenase-like lactoylglutathione lyase family enzyme|uniref:VOC family protein n=1 Tax=Tractidigestivibacter sp. TaxID=2847320 RepID=UPI003D936103
MGALVKGIDHVAMTVPDVEKATQFLEEAFDAKTILDWHAPKGSAVSGPGAERVFGMPSGGRWDQRRMLQVGSSVVELFHYEVSGQRDAARTVDYGITHMALLVDDVQEAARRFESAGGKLFAAHNTLDGRVDPETAWVYGRTPWGAVVELVGFPAQ